MERFSVMANRPFWINKIEQAWKKRSIVWLSGVRRAGKTTITKMFANAIYLNCDLPSVTRQLDDIESFLSQLDKNAVVILDEVHRLEDPSRLLKIAADEYKGIKILATGSSTLAATKKFRDSLTGRKQSIYLPPVLWTESKEVFNISNLEKRLLHGGLPQSLLTKEIDSVFFSEWLDSFYARDIQELFGIRNRIGFMKLLNLLLLQSGGSLDYTSLAKHSKLSQPTVMAHLEVMNIAHAIFLLRPFHGGGRREIIQQPKCYAFDTGFVAHVNGWDAIRNEDRGLLWEHLVLDTLRSVVLDEEIYYWRDKSKREIDFVLKQNGNETILIECKINPEKFEPQSLFSFRNSYSRGMNYVVSPFVNTTYTQKFEKHTVVFCGLEEIISELG